MKKLEATGTKWQRPPDYYAEMVKSDEHMARVKAQLMHEQGEIEGAQERWVLSALWVTVFGGQACEQVCWRPQVNSTPCNCRGAEYAVDVMFPWFCDDGHEVLMRSRSIWRCHVSEV